MKLTPRTQKLIQIAESIAKKWQAKYVNEYALLLAMLSMEDGLALVQLREVGITLAEVQERMDEIMGNTIPEGIEAQKILGAAKMAAEELKHDYIGTEHILMALLQVPTTASIIESFDVDTTKLLATLKGQEEADLPTIDGEKPKSKKTPALEVFGKDLTEAAKKNELDPVIGRADEIQRVIQTLCRRTKNNPVLIGEAGVGKTAIVEGLAQEIVEGRIPSILLGKKIIMLDLARMVAGTKYRGQFEERLKTVMTEIKNNPNIIVFIDELHTMVGAGSASGTMDASNMLKPALSRGEFQCIGATTLDEYRKYIEKDAALERRFQSIKVEAPSVDETILILKGLKDKYEAHHNATYTEDAIVAAAKTADRYISDRHLPDKAIDVLDEAAAKGRIQAMHVERAAKLNIKELELAKETAVKSQEYEKAAEMKKTIEDLQAQMAIPVKIIITEADIYSTISKMTGIPVGRIGDAEATRYLTMEAALTKRVIGQDESVQSVAKTIRRARADLKDPKRPIGSFLFLGPTGVGKTLLAKNIAEFMFGSEDALIQIDMSEYMEKHNVSRLIGAAPGYIGFEEGGQLSEAVRRKPYSVVLFDEVEKAHPDVLNIFLQILEDGRITDSSGRKIDFRNTVIVMTSNAGAQAGKRTKSMGFTQASDKAEEAGMKNRVIEEAKKVFKPEFLNRLTEIIVFNPMSKASLSSIVDLEFGKVVERLQHRGIKLSLSDQAQALLIEKGYDETYGARNIRRTVEKYVEDIVAEAILTNTLKSGEAATIILDKDNNLCINITSTKGDAKETA